MIYIKLDENMGLGITVYEPIYRGENLSKKITYLIPTTVGEIDMLTAIPYLSYIRADGVADIVRLERQEEKYKEAYYQYVLPVSCRLSKFPGEICSWLQIYSGTPSNPTIAKSGECLLYVEDSKNMDDYICDHQLSAIYAMQKESDTTQDTMESIRLEVEKKGDSMIYDKENKTIQLMSDGKPVGDPLDMSDMVNEDDVIYFEDDGGDEPEDPDAVIHF